MLKSKAIDILRTLSKEEFKRFEDFVRSPYFNSNKSIVRLITELSKFYPDFRSAILTEEFLYKKIYETDKYSYSLMRNLMSETLSLCEKFLLNERLNNNIFKNTKNVLHLLDEYQNRELTKLYNVRFANLNRNLAKEKFDNTFFRHQIDMLNLVLDDEYNKVSFKNSLKDIFFKKALFELCNIANSLYRNANSIYYISVENNINPDESYFFIFLKCIDIEKFLAESKKFRTGESVIIEIYLKLVILILYPENRKNYFEVKKSIFENIKKFTNRERYSLLNILRNYVLFEIKTEEENFPDEAKSINMEMLEKINFKEDKLDSILGVIYLSVFLEAVGKRDYIFAEEFINKYTAQLRKEIRKDMFGYTSAYMHFIKRNYEKALESLSHVKPPNKVYFVHIKNLYLKIYYELEYFDEGLSILDTYKHYLDNNKILNQEKKKYFTKIIRFYLRLYKIKISPEKFTGYDVIKLIEELVKDKLNIETIWIAEKAEDLKKLFK